MESVEAGSEMVGVGCAKEKASKKSQVEEGCGQICIFNCFSVGLDTGRRLEAGTGIPSEQGWQRVKG